jgi:hypothetical protein
VSEERAMRAALMSNPKSLTTSKGMMLWRDQRFGADSLLM